MVQTSALRPVLRRRDIGEDQMTRALLALLLTFAHFSADAAPRRRAIQHPAPPVAPAAIVTAAQQAAEAALKAGAPAVQIAVSDDGQIIYSGAFGLSDRESATAATPRSVLQIGSITKQFAAAAILRLAEHGDLTLDDSIEKFVPEYDPPGGVTITLRHLLTHTSGVRGLSPPEYTPLTRAQFIKLVAGQPLEFAPGTKFSYSNSGYRLLGYAIESITGMSFADYVHREFALPLGLVDTGVCGTSNVPLPDGYGLFQTWTRIPAIHMSVPFAAGSLCSTASDLVRWSHLLASGVVIQPASYATMTTPTLLANNSIEPYGLGQFLQKQLGRTAVWHTGGIPGFQSSLVYFPNEDLAVAVIVNALPAPNGVSAHLIAIDVARAALPTP
jgi:D-alanyl-D-alanine carboxypeptidase